MESVEFVNLVELSPTPGQPDNWTVAQDFVVRLYYDWAPTQTVVIPRGFVTDLASVPRLFWNILPPFGEYTEAAVLHDYFYRVGGARSKADADLALYYGSRACGVSWFVATVMWLAVTLFAGRDYRPGDPSNTPEALGLK